MSFGVAFTLLLILGAILYTAKVATTFICMVGRKIWQKRWVGVLVTVLAVLGIALLVLAVPSILNPFNTLSKFIGFIAGLSVAHYIRVVGTYTINLFRHPTWSA